MTDNLVTNTTLETVLIQVRNESDTPTGGLKDWVTNASWECFAVGFFGLGEDYCLKVIQKGMSDCTKKLKNLRTQPESNDKPVKRDKLTKERNLLVWIASTVKTVFGILKEIPDYKVKNLPKGDNLVILRAKLTFISKHFKGASLKLPPFDGLDASWVLWKEQTFSVMSAVGLDQLCSLNLSEQTDEDKRMIEALVRYDYWVGSALRGVLVKSRVSSIMLPKEGPVLASKIWAKLVGFFECESAKTYKSSTIAARVQTCRFKNIGELESGYNRHVRDCNYLVAIGQASVKQAAHYLINSFSGISSMGSVTTDSVDGVHNFFRNKTLEIDAGGRFKSKFESNDPKESKTGARKARRIVSSQKGSEAKNDFPVPRETYMKLTPSEKTYVKNHKQLPESAKRRFESNEAEGSDHEDMRSEKPHEGSTSGGSKKQKTKGKVLESVKD